MKADRVAYGVAAVCFLGAASGGTAFYLNRQESQERIARELENQKKREQNEREDEADADRRQRQAARVMRMNAARNVGLARMVTEAEDPWEIIAASGLDRSTDPTARSDMAMQVAAWSVQKLTWKHVTDDSNDKTSLGEASKDQRGETGKRLCATMSVERIEAREMALGKAYVAMGSVGGRSVILYAMNSSEGVVDGKDADFCGLFLFKDETHFHMVGLFDNDTNRSGVGLRR